MDSLRLRAYLQSIKWLVFCIPRDLSQYKRIYGLYKGNTSRKSCAQWAGYQCPGQKHRWRRTSDEPTWQSLHQKGSAGEVLPCSKYFGDGAYIFFLILFLQRRLLINHTALLLIQLGASQHQNQRKTLEWVFQPVYTRYLRVREQILNNSGIQTQSRVTNHTLQLH